VLGLKQAAREILLKQGIAPSRIPAPLLAQPMAGDYAERVRTATARIAYPLRAMQLQNGTGFDAKDVNVAKAVLYTLMPPGSVIKIPDSLWNGTFWGSALIGCALRGVRVLVIAPALANAPARAFGSMVRGRELAWRLVAASRAFAPEIAASGGLLKVGIFATELRVTDIAGKAAAVKSTFEQHEWLHHLFDFPDAVYPALDSIAAALRALPASADSSNGFESHDRSYLHLKANFFASREAWTVMSRADWAPLMGEFAQFRLAQLQRSPEAVASFAEYPDALRDIGGDVLRRWSDELPAATRARGLLHRHWIGQPERSQLCPRRGGCAGDLAVAECARLSRPHHAHRPEPVDRGPGGARRAPAGTFARQDAARALVSVRVLTSGPPASFGA
jgi:hypothetical protein